MAAATDPVTLVRLMGDAPIKSFGGFVATGETFEKGWYLARNASGLFVEASEATTLMPGGFADRTLEDAAAGDDTDLVNVDTGIFAVPMLSTSKFLSTDKPGPIYAHNNYEFAKSSSGRSIAGLFLFLDDSDPNRCWAWIGPEGAAMAQALVGGSLATSLHAPVANAAAMAAIPAAERSNGMLCVDLGQDEVWYFDSGSAAAASDYVRVPDAGTGRWLRNVPRLLPPAADATAVQAIAATTRYDGALVVKLDDSTVWAFDAGSAVAASDFAIVPDAGTGRWLRRHLSLDDAVPAMQAGDATLVAGTVTVNAGITVAANSEVIPIVVGAITGSANFACLRELKASRVNGAPGVGTIVLEAVGADGAKDADAAGAIRFVILAPLA